VSLYYFNLLYVGITIPGGNIYSTFLSDHLNYVSWIQVSILETANAIMHFAGVHSYVGAGYTLNINNVPILYMAAACAGLGIMSFWVAFIIAQKNTIKVKLVWCVAGIVSIWIINCLRVSLLFVALKNNWQVNKYIDHHELFNLCAYSVIILMMLAYNKHSKNFQH
jgi:exosortase/archaeosortase family protein